MSPEDIIAAFQSLPADEQQALVAHYFGRVDRLEQAVEGSEAAYQVRLWEIENDEVLGAEDFQVMTELVEAGHSPDAGWDAIVAEHDHELGEDEANEIADSAERQLGRELLDSEWRALGKAVGRGTPEAWKPIDLDSPDGREDFLNEAFNATQPAHNPERVFNLDNPDDRGEAIDRMLQGHSIYATENDTGQESNTEFTRASLDDWEYAEPAHQRQAMSDAEVEHELDQFGE